MVRKEDLEPISVRKMKTCLRGRYFCRRLNSEKEPTREGRWGVRLGSERLCDPSPEVDKSLVLKLPKGHVR